MELRLKWLVAICLSFTLLVPSLSLAEVAIKFEKKKISLGGKTLTVEIAESDLQHERGLMNRKSLGTNEGMLFVFKDEQIRAFWMKNTLINLSIGYFNKDKKLIDIQEMKAMTSIMQQDLPSYPSASPAMYALEMNEGWFKKNKIKLGTTFKYLSK